MTPHQVVGLAVRLFAILIALFALQIATLALAAPRGLPEATPLLVWAMSAVMLVMAVVLWVFPLAVAHKLLPRTQQGEPLQATSSEVAVVAFVVVGLLVCVTAIPRLASYIGLASLFLSAGRSIADLDLAQHINAIVGVAQVLVGYLLIRKARPWANRAMI